MAGVRSRTIIVLTSILLLTLLALGFAIGSIDNLKIKMDNPFTNWVDLSVNNDIYKKIEKMQERYEAREVADQFGLKSMVSFGRRAMDFYTASYDIFSHPKDTLKKVAHGRTIGAREAIYYRILDEKTGNVLWKAPELSKVEESKFTGCEIIISESLMEVLGYKDPSTIGHVLVEDDDVFYLKVVAVLKDLPGKNEFIMSPILFNIQEGYRNCRRQLLQVNKEGDNSFNFLLRDKKLLPELKKQANQFFSGKRPEIEVLKEFTFGNNIYWGSAIYFSPANIAPLDSVNLFLKIFREKYGVSNYSNIDCGGGVCETIGHKNIHYLAFHFDKLDYIRNFRNDMSDEFAVEIDMNKVESKENFALVSKLTLVTAIMLLLFSVLSIVLFVNNLLQTHLYKVRSNLGTFQAFGLDNNFLVKAYLKIIFCILFIATTMAFIISVAVDRCENYFLGDNSHFNIFNPNILLAVIAVVIVSVILSSKAIKHILNDTPGNLIYGR